MTRGYGATYSYDVTCQGSVPESVVAFLDATDYEDAIRNAISLGGDADTQACIAGGSAHAYFGTISPDLSRAVVDIVPEPLRPTWAKFQKKFRVPT